VLEQPGSGGSPDGASVRELLRRCGRTRDRAERAGTLASLAAELERAAEDITTRYGDPEVVAGLLGQASMARAIADLEPADPMPCW
jgi:hypothetical protein